MVRSRQVCPDCDSAAADVTRRHFLQSAAGTALAASALSSVGAADTESETERVETPPVDRSPPETVVARLYESLTDVQKTQICYDWDHQDKRRGLLRTFVSNNWSITSPKIRSDFYSGGQQAMIREVFEGIIQPDWHQRIDKQLKDDAGGFGKSQSIAIFGKPGSDNFEFVMTGRHMTLRCDGNSAPHVAFGGPLFYGHAAQGFNEASDHPGNVFWPQAVAANNVFAMLDGRQRKQSLVATSPKESAVAFQGADGQRPGIPISDLSDDQKAEMQKVLAKLIEPYRQVDRDEVTQCLQSQGGLDQCSLAFYEDRNIGNDDVWDNWRLEGPSFVWYFRGSPHVHVWVHVADDSEVKLNA